MVRLSDGRVVRKEESIGDTSFVKKTASPVVRRAWAISSRLKKSRESQKEVINEVNSGGRLLVNPRFSLEAARVTARLI